MPTGPHLAKTVDYSLVQMKWYFLVLLFFGMACQNRSPLRKGIHFNSDSLIDRQIELLQTRNALLSKQVDAKAATGQPILVSKVQWQKEFEPFRAINLINKPAYRDSYQVSITPDTKSNLTVKSWMAKAEAPVRTLRIYYLINTKRVKRIEAELVERNMLFSSSRSLQLEFSNLVEPWMIDTYKVSISQQFIWDGPDNFTLKASVSDK
jgi:hypothetical protein